MVYRFPPREAANKKALPHTAKKIAESSNLVDFIVNPSNKAIKALRSI